jgi:hypothetical protein
MTQSDHRGTSQKLSDGEYWIVAIEQGLSRDAVTSSREVRWLGNRADSPEPALWLAAVHRRLASFADLPANWDGEGAHVTSGLALGAAYDLLARVGVDGVPQPFVAAATDGGVLFEWESVGIAVLVELEPRGDRLLTISDRAGRFAWEGRLGDEPDGLEKWLWRLSNDMEQ